jgi:membrane protease YdiL (CAAX protease family)
VALVLALAVYGTTLLTFSSVISASGHELVVADVGDVFVKAREVAKYSAERLAAAEQGKPLPKPPVLYADLFSLKVELVSTCVYQILSVVVVGGIAVTACNGKLRPVIQGVGLDRNPLPFIWRPALLVLAAYAGVIVYAVLMREIGPGFLVPKSTVQSEVTRDRGALALAGAAALVFAPIAEESFFRGMMFTGLVRWGFWPAGAISALLFTSAHFDLGSLIPFFFVGLGMAWLYWSRGSLWDSIIFHFLFNFTSFLLLVAGS